LSLFVTFGLEVADADADACTALRVVSAAEFPAAALRVQRW